MRVGYGYNRDEKDFAHTNVEPDRIFIDTKATDRSERRDMFMLVKPGDTLVLLYKGDLARGAQSYDVIWGRVKSMGVDVEIMPPDGDKPKLPRGRPKVFDPSPKHDEEIKMHWHDPDRPGRYAVKVARRRGYDVTEQNVRDRYGPRFPEGDE